MSKISLSEPIPEPKITLSEPIQEEAPPDTSVWGATKHAAKEAVIGTGETLLSTLSGIPSSIAAQLHTLPQTIASSGEKPLTVQEAREEAARLAETTTYQPMTEGGKQGVQAVGEAFNTIFKPLIEAGGQIAGQSLGPLSKKLFGTSAPVEYAGEMISGLLPFDLLAKAPVTAIGKAAQTPIRIKTIRGRTKGLETPTVDVPIETPVIVSPEAPPVVETPVQVFNKRKAAVQKTLAKESITSDVLMSPGSEIKLGAQGDLPFVEVGAKQIQPNPQGVLDFGVEEKPIPESIVTSGEIITSGDVTTSGPTPIGGKVDIGGEVPVTPAPFVQKLNKAHPIVPPSVGDKVFYRTEYYDVDKVLPDGKLSLEGISTPIDGRKVLRATPEEVALNRAGFAPEQVYRMKPEERLAALNEIKQRMETPPTPEELTQAMQVDAKVKEGLKALDIELLKKNKYTDEQIAVLDDVSIRSLAKDIRLNIEMPADEGLASLSRSKKALDKVKEKIELGEPLDEGDISEIVRANIEAELAFDPNTHDYLAELAKDPIERAAEKQMRDVQKAATEVKAEKKNKTVKEPWQMTQSEFLKEATFFHGTNELGYNGLLKDGKFIQKIGSRLYQDPEYGADTFYAAPKGSNWLDPETAVSMRSIPYERIVPLYVDKSAKILKIHDASEYIQLAKMLDFDQPYDFYKQWGASSSGIKGVLSDSEIASAKISQKLRELGYDAIHIVPENLRVGDSSKGGTFEISGDQLIILNTEKIIPSATAHKNFVEAAIKEGKRVPKEIRDSYNIESTIGTKPKKMGESRRAKAKAQQEPAKFEGATEDLSMEIADFLGIPLIEARGKVQSALKAFPDADVAKTLKMLREKVLGDNSPSIDGRGVGDFISDVSNVLGGDETTLGMFIGQKGYEAFIRRLILGKDLTHSQAASRIRILKDMDAMRIKAMEQGKSLAQYMMENKYPIEMQVPFLGPYDKKWRLEIDDSQMRFKVNKEQMKAEIELMPINAMKEEFLTGAYLPEVVSYPTLYALYPFLRETSVYKMDFPRNQLGVYSPSQNAIYLNGHLPTYQMMHVIKHELTHGIQGPEGFARGGGAGFDLLKEALPKLKKYYERLAKEDKELAWTKVGTSDPVFKRNQLDHLEANLDNIREMPEEAIRNHFGDVMHDAYTLLAGEIEAREVATRGNLNKLERSKTPPEWEGILKEEAVVKYLDSISRMAEQESRQKPVTLDSLGLQQLYEGIEAKVKELKAYATNPGSRIAKIIGNQESDPRIKFPEKKPNDPTMLAEGLRTSMRWAAGTPAEDFVYRLNKGEMFAGHQHYVNSIGLRNILQDLRGKGEPKNIGKIVEGKAQPKNAAELNAAVAVKDFLAAMREKHKAYLRGQFENHLEPKEYKALIELLNAKDEQAILAKWNRAGLDWEVLWDIRNQYKKIDKWGLEDYIPKVELGTLKIMHEGKVVAVGFSKADAVRKATEYLERNPDATELKIDTNFNDISKDLTALKSSKQYFGIVSSLKKAIMEEVEGVSKGVAANMAKKALKRKFIVRPTDTFSPFLEPRRNVLLGEEDIFPVLYKYSRVMEKKWALDPLLQEARTLIPSVRAQGYNKLPETLMRLIDDVKGNKSWIDTFVDEILERGPMDVKPFAFTRATAQARKFEANAKLGWRPVNGLINLFSGNAHVIAKTGFGEWKKGIEFLRTPEGKALLDETVPYLGQNFIEEQAGSIALWKERTMVGKVAEAAKPLGLFQAAELPNREVGIAANYLFAKNKLGYDHAAAREHAIRANWFQNFIYNTADMPYVMRGPIGRTILQFKPYLIQELEFLQSLSAKEAMRYVPMMVALGGTRGAIMLAKSFPLLFLIPGFEQAMDALDQELNRRAPLATRGILGAVTGTDISAPATFQFPNEPLDFAGVIVNDIYKVYKGIIEPLKDLKGITAYDVSKTAGQIAPFWKHWRRLLPGNITKDGWVLDEGNKKMYQAFEPKASPEVEFMQLLSHTGKAIVGGTPVEQSMESIEERSLMKKEEKESWIKQRLAIQYLDYVKDGKPVPREVIQLIAKHNAVDSIESAMEKMILTPKQRRLMRADIRNRRDLLEYQPLPMKSIFQDAPGLDQ
jgi:hypothetical protein